MAKRKIDTGNFFFLSKSVSNPPRALFLLIAKYVVGIKPQSKFQCFLISRKYGLDTMSNVSTIPFNITLYLKGYGNIFLFWPIHETF